MVIFLVHHTILALSIKWSLTLFIIVSLPAILQAQFYYRGVVVDETRMALPGAVVCTYPDTICTVSGPEGAFEIRRRSPAARIEISYVGYKKKVLKPDVFDPPDHYHIILRPSTSLLGEVLITEDRVSRDVFQPVTVIGSELFEAESAGNFSAALSRLPGLSNISMGVGIGKPVIRGLYSNRVVVTDRGVKQESHQWGIDHGLEIDQFRPGAVEVVKGPASLKYGSDALGGVVRVRPDPIAERNSMYGSLKFLGKSNNKHLGSAVNFGISGSSFFASANYSRQAFSDYRVPADGFVYNTFELPLFNQRLKNTAGREEAWSVTTGYRNDKNLIRLTFSEYNLEAGIFSGAFGIPLSFTLQDDGDDRNIDFPKQEVVHRKVVGEYRHFFTADKSLEIIAGYQFNRRREFSFPEFHAIPGRNPNERLALELDLQTVSLSGVFRGFNQFSFGFQGQYQKNQIDGFDYFLPPFEVYRFGIFALRELQLSEEWRLKGGLRLDYGHNDHPEAGRYVWTPGGQIIDSLFSLAESTHFFNYSASAAALFRPTGREDLDFSINLGKTFRIPYPVETSANGVHHGTFRHEQGLAELKSEHGYQLDLALRYYRGRRLFVNLTPFFNYFHNYIYLRPAAAFSSLPDAGQLYRYEQHNAIFYGFELELEYALTHSLKLYHAIESVWNYNTVTRLSLPFTPPVSVFSSLSWGRIKPFNWLGLKFDVSHRFVFAQNQVDRNELTTPSYHITSMGMEMQLPNLLAGTRILFRAHNLFDEFYLDHLSRYRQLGIPEQGRNFTLQLIVPFKGRL